MRPLRVWELFDKFNKNNKPLENDRVHLIYDNAKSHWIIMTDYGTTASCPTFKEIQKKFKSRYYIADDKIKGLYEFVKLVDN